MRVLKRLFTAVLVLGALLIPSFSSCAEESDAYDYTVTFYSGAQGSFHGSDKLVHSDLSAGSRIFFNAQSAVSLEADSKYYVKGVRLSGRDNAEAEMSTITIDVHKDADYVVVYGIKGNQVKYTVKYEDEQGRELAPSDVFYGNVGDKPVVAYKYIEKYVPKAVGLTKTLSQNEAENVFTFVYADAADGVRYVDGETTVIYKDTVSTIIRGGTGGGTGAGTGTAAEGENGQNAEESQDIQTPGGESQDESEGQQGIVDLDDEETPLGNMDLDDGEVQKGLPMLGIISLVGISILALIAMVVLVLRLKDRMKN